MRAVCQNTMSCLPDNWEVTSSNASLTPAKRRRNEVDDGIDSVVAEFCRDIKHVEATHDHRDVINELPRDVLFSEFTFVNELHEISHSKASHVPIVSRAYEESFMRECMSRSEQACVMGANCECMMIDPVQPFVGVRFVLPFNSEVDFTPNNLCILCLRKTTQLLFHHVIAKGVHTTALIQKHGNICGEPGEYSRLAMLICPPHGPVGSMPLPVVAHQRNRYYVEKRHNVLHVRQQRVYFEDF